MLTNIENSGPTELSTKGLTVSNRFLTRSKDLRAKAKSKSGAKERRQTPI
jgi:hypothetical protein